MSRIAIVISTVGYHWQELFDAYDVFARAREEVSFYTVDGAPPRPDPLSIRKTGPAALLGIGVPARIAPDSERGTALRERLLEVAPVASLDPARCDALYLPGGHGCLFDVNQSPLLHRKVAELYTRKALLSAVCHATSTFALTTIGGRSIVTGHELTGFPDPLDQTLIRLGLVHPDFLPLPLVNDDVLRAGGAKLSKQDVMAATINPRTVRVSLPFITGVGPKAAARTARLVLSAMAVDKARPATRSPHVAAPARASRIG